MNTFGLNGVNTSSQIEGQIGGLVVFEYGYYSSNERKFILVNQDLSLQLLPISRHCNLVFM